MKRSINYKKNTLLKSALLLLSSSLFSKKILGVCPVCSVAVGVGVGFTQFMGIDDTISGLWIGAMTLSIAIWIINFLEARNIKFIGRKITVIIASYLLVILPLYKGNYFGQQGNKIFSMDKLAYGIALGSIIFLIGSLISAWLKKQNNGRVYFPLQKVLLPLIALIIASLALYIYTK